MASSTNTEPFGIHQASHNTIASALDELKAALATPVRVPPVGSEPERELPFDRLRVAQAVKTAAQEVVRLDLWERGEKRSGHVSVEKSTQGSMRVYSSQTIASAQALMNVTNWDFAEDKYFVHYKDSDGNYQVSVSHHVADLLQRASADQERSADLRAARERTAAHREYLERSADRFSLDGPDASFTSAPERAPSTESQSRFTLDEAAPLFTSATDSVVESRTSSLVRSLKSRIAGKGADRGHSR